MIRTSTRAHESSCATMLLRSRRTTWVRVLSVSAALLVVCLHASTRGSSRQSANQGVTSRETRDSLTPARRLFSLDLSSSQLLSDDGDSDEDVDNANCTHPLAKNNSCEFVYEYCSDDVQLFNYLGFVACQLPHVKVH